MKISSSNLRRTCCVQKLFLSFRTIFVHNNSPNVLQKEELLTKIYLYMQNYLLKTFKLQLIRNMLCTQNDFLTKIYLYSFNYLSFSLKVGVLVRSMMVPFPVIVPQDWLGLIVSMMFHRLL